MVRRPVPSSRAELDQLIAAGIEPLLPTAPPFTAEQVDLFNSVPKGYFVNDSGAPNCKIHNRVLHRPLGVDLMLPVIVALRDLKAGEEILVSYNNNDSRRHRQQEHDASEIESEEEEEEDVEDDDEGDWEAFRQLAVPKPKHPAAVYVE